MRRQRLIRWWALMACLMCAMNAGAYDFQVNGIYYARTSDGSTEVEVTYRNEDFHSYSGVVNIPSTVTYNNVTYTVVGIGREAFYYCHDMTHVTLPPTLRYINDYAFFDCPNLDNVTLPDGLTYIGADAFCHCNGSGFTKIVIPDAVTTIDLSAFNGCTHLTSVTIGSGVKYIRQTAFKDCTALTNVTCKAMTPPTMNSDTFDQSHYSNVNLKVPRSSLSAYQAHSVWSQFSNIQALNYDFIEDNIPYRIMNAAEQTVAVTYETYGAHSGVVTIPETVTHDNVTYVVTNIDSHAFRNCSNLTVINLPVTLQYIGTYAFYNCTSLTSVRIPDNVWYVASWAFQGCTNLASVDLGSGLTQMGNSAFTGCTSLTNIRCRAYTPPAIMAATLSDQYDMATLTVPYMSLSNYRNADYWGNFTNIKAADYDFEVNGLYYIRTGSSTASVSYRDKNYNCYSGDVGIPDQVTNNGVIYSVTGIREDAFSYCTGLTSIEFPRSSLKLIGSAAFQGCTSLTKVDIPNSVTLVKGLAFYGCTNLTHVIIGENCSFTNQFNVFKYCDNVQYVTCFAKTPPQMDESDFSQATYANALLLVPQESESLYAAAPVWKLFQNRDITDCDFMVDGIYYKKIGENNVGVASKDVSYGSYSGDVIVPATVEYEGVTYDVTTVRNNAFAVCHNLWSVTLPNSITSIDYNAFRDCAISSIVVPDAVAQIAEGAFRMCHNLRKVTLGSCLRFMGNVVFYDTPALEKIVIGATTPPTIMNDTFDQSHYSNVVVIVPKSCKPAYQAAAYWSNFTHYGQINYDFEKDGVYYNITSNSTVEVTSETDYYGNYSDSYEGEVVIPGFVTYGGRTYTVNAIGNNAFKMCKGMTKITMPATIETIGSYAFHYCEGLTEVDIPFSVTEIKDHAFWLCMGLTEVVIPNGVTTIGSMAFRNCSALQKVVIGKSVTSIGSTSFYYCPDISEVTCLAEVPPILADQCFMTDVYRNAALRVPYASHEAYCDNDKWSQFAHIVSKQDVNPVLVGDVNGDDNVTIIDVTALIDLLLGGGEINNPAADVNGDGRVNITDLTALIDNLLSGNSSSGATSGPARREFLINRYGFSMIKVDGGTFMMGLEGDNVATPIHQVTLSDYHIGETEVTQALWTHVMGSNPSGHSGVGDLPVENVSWYTCQGFINELNALFEENFSLPTEAQWEFAARGGNKSKGYTYAGSNNVNDVAWYLSNSDNTTHPVATKQANELGLYDMSGNVFEWCQDYWGAYTSAAQVDPQGPDTGTTRVCRGSAYVRGLTNNWLKCGGRTQDDPSVAAIDSGLRLSIQPASK